MHYLAFSSYYFLVANTVCPMSCNLWLSLGEITLYEGTQSKVIQSLDDNLGCMLCDFICLMQHVSAQV